MSRVQREDGFTLIELLVGASIMLVVMGAVLTAMNQFQKTSRSSDLRAEGQLAARATMDQLARQLRNGAAATAAAPTGLTVATSYDLIFQTVDRTKPAGSSNAANLRRDRYCLDFSNPGNARLMHQSQTWTGASAPAVPSSTQCPGAAWGNSRVVVENIVNRRNNQDRPVFVPNSATASQVSRLGVQLFMDADRGTAGTPRREVLLRSGIDLRNANQPPTASFTAFLRSGGRISLNASASTDPESEPLSYKWYDGTTLLPGTGVTYDYTPTASGNRTIRLLVFDPAGLRGEATRVVDVP